MARFLEIVVKLSLGREKLSSRRRNETILDASFFLHPLSLLLLFLPTSNPQPEYPPFPLPQFSVQAELAERERERIVSNDQSNETKPNEKVQRKRASVVLLREEE